MSYANYFNSAGTAIKEVTTGNLETDILTVDELKSDKDGEPIKVTSTLKIVSGSDIEIERNGEVISFNNLIERVKSLELFMNTFNQAFVMGSLEEDGTIIQYNQ